MFSRLVRVACSSVPKKALEAHKPSWRPCSVAHRRDHHHSAGSKPVTSQIKPIEDFIKSSLKGATTSEDKEVLTLNFDGGANLKFPSIWLRDNCRCDECFDHVANSRLIDQTVFRPDTIPTAVKVDENSVKIIWDDGHRSEFNKDWICKHSFDSQHQHDREPKFHEERIPWNTESFPKVYQTFPYEKVLNDDETLLRWLVALAQHGATMVTDAPVEEGIVQKLASRVAFIKYTLYGDIFVVKSKEGATNTAYKKGQLQLHSDMPFYHHLPGSIFLHCIVQSKNGGENLLTDGINVAKQLDPEQYRTLADTVINWSDIGSDKNFFFHSLNREPCICEDKLGNIRKINWSQPQRDSRFDVPIPVAIKWYKAMSQYSKLLHHPTNAVTLKMQPGDILTIDNRRVLHSRANYSDGARQLNGAYLDWDEIYPKIRVLRNKLKIYD